MNPRLAELAELVEDLWIIADRLDSARETAARMGLVNLAATLAQFTRDLGDVADAADEAGPDGAVPEGGASGTLTPLDTNRDNASSGKFGFGKESS